MYYTQSILAHTLVHYIYNVEEMRTDRSANGAVEKFLLLGKKLVDGALTLTICLFIDLTKNTYCNLKSSWSVIIRSSVFTYCT